MDLTTARQTEVPLLLDATSNTLDTLHDRIDQLFDRTEGVRLTKPTPGDSELDAKRPSTGAFIIDSLAVQNDRLWWAVNRLERLLDELEV